MNILILTPDAVGSTLLQRLITIYMQFHEYDRPVINLHELTNGLQKYFSPEFGREIVSKRHVTSWGYHQSLQEIVELLASVDHYKTSRLAQYHIKNRGDSIEQQIPFYRYLDSNFFVIACRRHNVFEHALSMTINNITKKLNVYSHSEKIETFIGMCHDSVSIDEQAFENQLEAYKNYLQWSQDHFNISSFFYYDQHLTEIEQFIIKLPIWPTGSAAVTWQQKFGLSLNDWNRCHHIPSDLTALPDPEQIRLLLSQELGSVTQDTITLYQQYALPEWPAISCIEDYHALPAHMKNHTQQHKLTNLMHIRATLPPAAAEFIERNMPAYQHAQSAIKRMQDLDIIMSPPPIKKQTLAEKMRMITNADRCLDIYNDWVQHNPRVASTVTAQDILQQNAQEQAFWRPFSQQGDALSGARPSEMLVYQNDDHL